MAAVAMPSHWHGHGDCATRQRRAAGGQLRPYTQLYGRKFTGPKHVLPYYPDLYWVGVSTLKTPTFINLDQLTVPERRRLR